MDFLTADDPRPIHFMGVGGAGMSALALLALRRGVTVTGCDTDLAGTADVANAGGRVDPGHDAAHVEGARAVVVTAAVKPDHPELAAARRLGIPVIPRKDALAALVNGRTVVAAAGTHGKTTTTVMATEALAGAGLAPTGLAGGRVGLWGGNARLDGDTLFVVEADKYDKAFLTLEPTVAIVNNVEADHLECYASVANLEAAFAEFAGRAETTLVGVDDAGARRLASRLDNVRVWRFGFADDADLRLSGFDGDAEGSRALLALPDGREVALRLRVPGRHNMLNATGALGAVVALGGSVERALDALEQFTGVGRRFERLGQAGGVAIVDDYAHHPSELVATLAAARQAYPGRRLVAVFQPHLYSRTAQHGAAMGEALAAADIVLVTDVYAARESPMAGISGKLVADAAARGRSPVHFVAERADVTARVAALLEPGDVVLTLGAGDITRVGPELLQRLAVR